MLRRTVQYVTWAVVRSIGIRAVLAFAAAIAALAVVGSSATGAVSMRCAGRSGYASVPTPFWPLLIGSIFVGASLAAVPRPPRTTAWLSLAVVVVFDLVSLAIFWIGYDCHSF
jgi:hypothetical protein